MADLNKTSAVRDGSVNVTLNSGAASQTIVANVDEKMCIYVRNTDATTARVRVAAGTGMRKDIGSIYKDVAQNGEAIIGPLDSMRFKDVSTGKYTVTITGTNDGAFGGTVSNVKLAVIELP
jgi:hypothetical protein